MFVEEWRDVKGYEGSYRISNIGRVLSLSRRTKFGRQTKTTKDRILRPQINTHGYPSFDLNDIGEGRGRKMRAAHRLIADAFDLPGHGPFVNHIDGNKSNNWIGNLENCTAAENTQHSFKTGLSPRGDKCRHSVLTQPEAILIRFWRKIGRTRDQIREGLGRSIKQSTIDAVYYRANWKWLA